MPLEKGIAMAMECKKNGLLMYLFAASLSIGSVLTVGERLSSSNGNCYTQMQADGNLVLYRTFDKRAFWASDTMEDDIRPELRFQDDGNLVIYKQDGAPGWNSGTSGNSGSGARLVMQDDGNLVLYNGDGQPLWQTATYNMAACSGGMNSLDVRS